MSPTRKPQKGRDNMLLHAQLVSIPEFKARKAKRATESTGRRWRSQHGPVTFNRSGDVAVNLNYFFAVQRTTAKMSEDQNASLVENSDGAKKTVVVIHEDGRRFDKIHFAVVDVSDGSKSTVRVAYFIERKTGNIYGPKTPATPNINWYFGTIFSSDMWDWSGERGKSLDEKLAGVKKAGAYGNYDHYEPLTEAEKKAMEAVAAG